MTTSTGPQPIQGCTWKIVLGAGTSLNVETSSEGFAPMLMLLDENLVLLRVWLNLAESNTLRVPWTARAGTFHIVVTPTQRTLGTYQLRVSRVATGVQQ